MPTLHIKFSGLCNFVFDRRLKPGQGANGDALPPSEAVVLLQRLTRARPISNLATTTKQEILDQHFPLLEFSLADYDPASTRFADVHCSPDASGKMTKGTCLLNGEDLTLLTDGRKMEPNSLELSRDRPADAGSPNLSKRERDSLWWMATLEDAFPKDAEINPLVLNTPPGSNQPILARMLLSEGRLRTLELTDFVCTIVPPVSPNFNQRVATSFEFSIPFSNSITIQTVANRSGRTTPSELVLRPDGGGDIQIEIMNVEINRLVGLDPASGPRAEADFGVYADLLKNPILGSVPFLRQAISGDPASAPLSTCVPSGGGAAGGTS
ncbi:MAG TPA: hypothetical protein VGH73_19015 [Thermoanaerobaculia bacterium]|jgi:hypothetical protein